MNGHFSPYKPTFIIHLLVCLLLMAGMFFLPGRPGLAQDAFTILDTVGAAVDTQFYGSGSMVLSNEQHGGPAFSLTQPTILTEIGAFLNICGYIIGGVVQECASPQPVRVEIRPSLNGVPHPTAVIASYEMSDDNDPSLFSFETAQMHLLLEPGDYFAIFTHTSDVFTDWAHLLGRAVRPYAFQPERIPLGVIYPLDGITYTTTYIAAVRILGRPAGLDINIDIKPGTADNPVNPKSRGVIQVAVLSTPSFDALSQVDTASLTFGRTGSEPSLAACLKNGRDVNRDGLADLVCHFHTYQAGFTATSSSGILKGRTVSGLPIVGSDHIRIVP